MKGDRTVAGLRCSEVLERLSDYVDGELQPAERRAVEEHLRGCDACSRFGDEFSATLQALRTHLLGTPCDEARLRQRIHDAMWGRNR